MGTVTIINSKPHKKAPVPEVGKTYNFYDDGKESRCYTARVCDIIPSKRAWMDLRNTWKWQKQECNWLYAKHTDYFVLCSIPNYTEKTVYFVRTVDGGWFSIGYPEEWMCGRLEV